MKILMIHQHYFPEMTGTARRTKELSEAFVNKGYKVKVITSFPRDFRSMPGEKSLKSESLNGVEVNRIKTLFQIKNNVFFRMLSYLTFVIQSLFLAYRISKKSDIVITIAPISSGIVGALVKFFNRKIHHHFDVPDILPDLGISAGMIKNKFLIKILFILEKWVYGKCDTISAITIGQIENIKNKGVSKSKLFYIPDWIDDSFFRKNLKENKINVQKSLKKYSNKKLISFVGNIGALQNPKIFIQMMQLKNTKDKNFHFLFIGDGIMLEGLKDEVRRNNIQNVSFVGRVARELIPAYMNLSDVLVANYLPNKYMDICIPGKLFEYAISNKPIVMGSNGEAKKLIEEYNLGLVARPSNIYDFEKAFNKIFDSSFKFNPDLNRFVEDFSLKKVSDSYSVIFNQIINK